MDDWNIWAIQFEWGVAPQVGLLVPDPWQILPANYITGSCDINGRGQMLWWEQC